jgi:hypothetical protein
MQHSRAANAERPSNCRSRLTNDPLRIAGMDARSARGRRLRDLIEQFAAALGGLNTLDRQTLDDVRRAAELTMLAEEARVDLLRRGGDANALAGMVKLENAVDRSVRRLRLKPGGQGAATPSLAEYLRDSASQAAADEPADAGAADEPPHEPERAGDDANANAGLAPTEAAT